VSNSDWVDDPTFKIQSDNDGWVDDPTFKKDSAVDSGKAFLDNFGNTALMGYGAQAKALVEKPLYGALNAITGNDVEPDDYLKARDGYLRESKKLSDEHPIASGAGMLAGGLSTALIPGVGAAKGATALARIGNAAKTSAVIGGAYNPGDTEGEISPLQLGDRGINAAKGFVIGGGLQGLGEGVSKAVTGSGNYFKNLAEEKAVKATGAMKRDFKNLGSQEKVNDLGRTLLDEKIVTPFSRPKEIANRIGSKIGETADDLKVQLQKADDVLQRPEGFNMENATTDQINAYLKGQPSTKQIRDNLVAEIKQSYKGAPEEELAPAIDKIDMWLKNKPEYMSVSELQELKTGLNNFLKKSDFYAPQPSIAKEGLLSIRKGAKEAIEGKANAAAEVMGEAGGGIKATNKRFGQLLEAQDLVDDAIGRDAANRSISLTDTISGAAGGTIAGIPGAIASTAGNKLGRMYGNSLMATGFDKVSKTLLQSPRFLKMSQENPKAFASMVNGLANNPKFNANPQTQQNNTPLLDRLSDDPSKMDVLKNEKLKEQLQKQQEQRRLKEHVPVEEAQASFINGN